MRRRVDRGRQDLRRGGVVGQFRGVDGQLGDVKHECRNRFAHLEIDAYGAGRGPIVEIGLDAQRVVMRDDSLRQLARRVDEHEGFFPRGALRAVGKAQ